MKYLKFTVLFLIPILILAFINTSFIDLSWGLQNIPQSVMGIAVKDQKTQEDKDYTFHIQTKLKQYGFYFGPIDGIVGPLTLQAIQDYKISNGQKNNSNSKLQLDQLAKELDSNPNMSSFILGDGYPSDINAIKRRGKLVVGMINGERFPFFYGDKDVSTGLHAYGFDVRLIKTIAQDLGVDIEVDNTCVTHDQLVGLLKDRKVDMVVSRFSITKERMPDVLFTDPYVNLRRTLLGKRGTLSKMISSKNDPTSESVIELYSGRIGVLRGSAYETYVKEDLPMAKVVLFDSWDEVVKALVRGNVDLIYRDEIEMITLLHNRYDVLGNYDVFALGNRTDSVAIGLPNNSFGLLAYLNSLLVLERANTYDVSVMIRDEYRTSNWGERGR